MHAQRANGAADGVTRAQQAQDCMRVAASHTANAQARVQPPCALVLSTPDACDVACADVERGREGSRTLYQPVPVTHHKPCCSAQHTGHFCTPSHAHPLSCLLADGPMKLYGDSSATYLAIASEIEGVPGVAGHGLFLDIADAAVIAMEEGEPLVLDKVRTRSCHCVPVIALLSLRVAMHSCHAAQCTNC